MCRLAGTFRSAGCSSAPSPRRPRCPHAAQEAPRHWPSARTAESCPARGRPSRPQSDVPARPGSRPGTETPTGRRGCPLSSGTSYQCSAASAESDPAPRASAVSRSSSPVSGLCHDVPCARSGSFPETSTEIGSLVLHLRACLGPYRLVYSRSREGSRAASHALGALEAWFPTLWKTGWISPLAPLERPSGPFPVGSRRARSPTNTLPCLVL